MNLEQKFAYEALSLIELDKDGIPSLESIELLVNFINNHNPKLIGSIFYHITNYPDFLKFTQINQLPISIIQKNINNSVAQFYQTQNHPNLPAPTSNLPRKKEVKHTATLDQPSSLETIKNLQTKILSLPDAELIYLAKQISPNIYNFERLPSGLHERSEVFTRQPDKLITEILKQPPNEKQNLINIIKSLLKQIKTETDRRTAQIHALIDNNSPEHHLTTKEQTPIPPILYKSDDNFNALHPQTPAPPKKPISPHDRQTKVIDYPFKPKK